MSISLPLSVCIDLLENEPLTNCFVHNPRRAALMERKPGTELYLVEHPFETYEMVYLSPADIRQQRLRHKYKYPTRPVFTKWLISEF